MANHSKQTIDLNYRNLFTVLPERYIIFAANDPIYTIIDINRAQAKITMTTPKSVINKSLFEVFPDVSKNYLKKGVSEMRESLRRVIRTRKPHFMGVFRYDIKSPSDTFVERYWRTENLPILDDSGDVAFILQTSQDITDEILKEQRLKQIEHQLSDALVIGKVGSWMWDVPSNKLVGDKNLADMFGVDRNESAMGVTIETFTTAIHPDDRERVVKHIQKTLKDASKFNDEYRTFGSDGTIHWVIARGQLELDKYDKPLKFQGVVVDITDRKYAEEELKHQSAFIETITRSIGDGVYAIDRDGIVTFVNDAAQQVLGYRSRELVGYDIHNLTHYRHTAKGTTKQKPCSVLTSILEGTAQSGEDRFINKKRNVFPVSYTSAPIFDTEGNVTGGVVAFSDITEQKKIEDTLRYQSLIVDSISDAIITIDLNSAITGWNLGAARLFGYEEKEALGKPREYVLHLSPKYNLKLIQQHALKHTSWHGNLSYIRKQDGVKVYVSSSVSALRNASSEPIGFVTVMRDISEINRAQEEVEAAKVRARTSHKQAEILKKKNEELVNLSRTKDEFIALASHQLRTPATGVKQYLGMVLEGFSEPLTPGQQNFLERAYACNERQLRIVEDILRVAQVDLDKIQLHKERTDICEIIADVIDNQSGKFESRKQHVKLQTPDGPVFAVVDRERFRMAIDNILDNASKYTQNDKAIKVVISKPSKTLCKIRVKDQGVGISKKDLPKLFQKFSRLDNPLSVEVGGNGLGLYWTKKIVNLHGGDITISSQLKKGSCFTITIPLKDTTE